MSMEDNSKILIGLLAGLAAGAAIGILLAPENGNDTRSGLSESLTKLGKSVKETFIKEIDKLGGLNIAGLLEKLVGEKIEIPDDLEHA
jgi:gas vesicle protein